MIRRTFIRRMALAVAACAFFDVPWPKARPESVTLQFTGWPSYDLPATGPITVYASWREHGEVTWRDSLSRPLELTGDPTHRQLTMGRVVAIRGRHSLEHMRSISWPT